MGPYQRTPKEVGRAIRYSGFGVRSLGPVGDFLEQYIELPTTVGPKKNNETYDGFRP